MTYMGKESTKEWKYVCVSESLYCMPETQHCKSTIFQKNFFEMKFLPSIGNGKNLEFLSPYFHTKLKFSGSLNEYPLFTAIPTSPYCLTLNLFHSFYYLPSTYRHLSDSWTRES